MSHEERTVTPKWHEGTDDRRGARVLNQVCTRSSGSRVGPAMTNDSVVRGSAIFTF